MDGKRFYVATNKLELPEEASGEDYIGTLPYLMELQHGIEFPHGVVITTELGENIPFEMKLKDIGVDDIFIGHRKATRTRRRLHEDMYYDDINVHSKDRHEKARALGRLAKTQRELRVEYENAGNKAVLSRYRKHKSHQIAQLKRQRNHASSGQSSLGGSACNIFTLMPSVWKS